MVKKMNGKERKEIRAVVGYNPIIQNFIR